MFCALAQAKTSKLQTYIENGATQNFFSSSVYAISAKFNLITRY